MLLHGIQKYAAFAQVFFSVKPMQDRGFATPKNGNHENE